MQNRNHQPKSSPMRTWTISLHEFDFPLITSSTAASFADNISTFVVSDNAGIISFKLQAHQKLIEEWADNGTKFQYIACT